MDFQPQRCKEASELQKGRPFFSLSAQAGCEEARLGKRPAWPSTHSRAADCSLSVYLLLSPVPRVMRWVWASCRHGSVCGGRAEGVGCNMFASSHFCEKHSYVQMCLAFFFTCTAMCFFQNKFKSNGLFEMHKSEPARALGCSDTLLEHWSIWYHSASIYNTMRLLLRGQSSKCHKGNLMQL